MDIVGSIDRTHWQIDPQLAFLNHGSFGACPKAILEKQRTIQNLMERSPVAFFLRELAPLIDQSKQKLAAFLDADIEGLVQVVNASEGVSTVLNSIQWQNGDEVIITTHTYLACKHMIESLVQRYGIQLKCVDIDWEALQLGELVDEEVWLSAFSKAYTPKTRLALIDHITSPSGLIVPIKPLISFFKDRQVITLIDGAHAPGHIPLSIRALGADFYTGNAHKWMFAPKGCAFLYVSPPYRETTMPLVISHGYRVESSRFQALFDWTGTRDYSAWAVLKDAIEWVDQQGGFTQFMTHNHTLLLQARSLIIDHIWSAPPPLVPSHSLGALATIPLPSRYVDHFGMQSIRVGPVEIHPLQEYLYQKQIEVPVIPWIKGQGLNGSEKQSSQLSQLYLRISAQVYNRIGDYQRLADALLEAL